MKIRKRPEGGFTVIELLVVIVIVCMLGAFVGLAYSGVQTKHRNAERQNDIDQLKSQLEDYYAEATNYPTLANLNDFAWRAAHLKHVGTDTFRDPSWKASIAACTAKAQPVPATSPTADCYSYQVTGPDGSPCDNAATMCAHYTLTATLEGGEKYVKTSLN
ncbi:MAG TPA: prepilin-type N-terminal cleavage/methylation domain-containing protein [Candidatus Saccharimonadales bacterium]|nr:prepilin-type N-terminal cleavage/methylation domain-containing protein [Candidatus Saccharimonadales bacterium]